LSRGGVARLPEFEGFTVDARLREFRKVTWKGDQPVIEFIPFASAKGMRLLRKMRK